MKKVSIALGTNERFTLQQTFSLFGAQVQSFGASALNIVNFLIIVESLVDRFPNTAELSNRSKDGSFELIKIVIEIIGILNESIIFVSD